MTSNPQLDPKDNNVIDPKDDNCTDDESLEQASGGLTIRPHTFFRDAHASSIVRDIHATEEAMGSVSSRSASIASDASKYAQSGATKKSNLISGLKIAGQLSSVGLGTYGVDKAVDDTTDKVKKSLDG